MMGTPLESDAHLSEVKVNQPYSTSEQYMDTYFRLLRTECFSGMQSGIKDLLSGTLGGHSITTCTKRGRGIRIPWGLSDKEWIICKMSHLLDHPFKTSACLRGEGCPHLPMVKRSLPMIGG